ncbi:MAG TPA: DUF222 domain-containing protein [Galbitalea sp.]
MTSSAALFAQATAVLGELARVDRSMLSDAEVIEFLRAEEGVGRLLDTSRALSAGEVAERSRWELGAEGLSMRFGHRKPVHLIEQVTRVSQQEAARRIRVGAAIRPRTWFTGEARPAERPAVAAAMADGMLGMDAAVAIISCLKQAERANTSAVDNIDAAETALVAMGATHSVQLVWDAARAWRDALDPNGVEPRYEQIRSKSEFLLFPLKDGLTPFRGNASPTMAAQLHAIFTDSTSRTATPRFLSEDDAAAGTETTVNEAGETITTITDPRSRGQKQHDILEGVLLAAVRATKEGPANLRTTGDVTAVILFTDLIENTGTGILQGIEDPVPAEVIREIACEAGIRKIILGPGGEVLWEGVLERYFTPAQRRAIVARDGDRCLDVNCTAPATACHAHHVVFWADRGTTDVDNGVMLCPAHHHALHAGAFEIKMINGKPWIRYQHDNHDNNAWQPAGQNRILYGRAA